MASCAFGTPIASYRGHPRVFLVLFVKAYQGRDSRQFGKLIGYDALRRTPTVDKGRPGKENGARWRLPYHLALGARTWSVDELGVAS